MLSRWNGPSGARSHRKTLQSVPKRNRNSYSDDLCCRPCHATLCLWQPAVSSPTRFKGSYGNSKTDEPLGAGQRPEG